MKELIFAQDARKTIKTFPREVRHTVGQALRMAQRGDKHPSAKPLKGFGGAGVIEIFERSSDGTYRVVYATIIKDRVYVLHAFKKKSTSGIATPKHEIDLVKQRLREMKEGNK